MRELLTSIEDEIEMLKQSKHTNLTTGWTNSVHYTEGYVAGQLWVLTNLQRSLKENMPVAQLARILHDVYEERERQDKLWGGPEHDDQHDAAYWNDLINRYCTQEILLGPEAQMRQFIKIAAIAVSAAQSTERKYGL